MSFNIALTGLTAANKALDVTANNLANASTTGFKQSRTEFSDLYASTQLGVAATAVGAGVAVTEVAGQFTQGDIESTGNDLDIAISGNGFFTVSNAGALQYTRNGEFQVDANGNVVTSTGAYLQVYPALSNGTYNTGTLTDLNVSTGISSPTATTTANITANLPAESTTPVDAATFDPTDANSYNNTTSMTVYDSLGAAHTATMYFTNEGGGNWNVNMYIDGNAVGTAQTLTYDNTGALTSPANGELDFGAYTPTTGAADMDFTMDMSATTQYGSEFDVTAEAQDGYTTGKLSGITIDTSGVVQAQYTNGKTINLGQMAIANFANPQGLQQLGSESYASTYGSGAPVMGVAGTSGFGSVEDGALEDSNVDTTASLVQMITQERAFQANSQMIQTEDSITQSVIQMAQAG